MGALVPARLIYFYHLPYHFKQRFEKPGFILFIWIMNMSKNVPLSSLALLHQL
jgi:hypothetical protein